MFDLSNLKGGAIAAELVSSSVTLPTRPIDSVAPGLASSFFTARVMGEVDGRVAEVDRVPQRNRLAGAVVDELLELRRQRQTGDVDLADQALVGHHLGGGDNADGGRCDDRLEVRIGF